MEELEAMRLETAERLKTLEAAYWGKKDLSEVGPKIRDKYKDFAKTSDSLVEDGDERKDTIKTTGILKNKSGKRGRSRSRSGKKSYGQTFDETLSPD